MGWSLGQSLTDSRRANLGANAIHLTFYVYQNRFGAITRRSKFRFENRDWTGMASDAAERLDTFGKVIERVMAEIYQLLGERAQDKIIWASMTAVYSGLIARRDNWELAETFFNSVTRHGRVVFYDYNELCLLFDCPFRALPLSRT